MSRTGAPSSDPLVIAHRGASGYFPEHTLAGYAAAIEQGADFIEPDLVMTRDGVLVVRHENEIGGTTDVAERAEFAARRTVKLVDGVSVSGWFTEDFTLAELKTLRARERLPQLRRQNVRLDGQLEIPTFEEVLDLVAAAERQHAGPGGPRPGRRIGIYPETKHPSHFARLGLPMEAGLVSALARRGYTGADAPVFIQSFEMGNLRALRRMTALPLVQLVAAQGAPYDLVLEGSGATYAELLTPLGLARVAAYAQALGPEKSLVIGRTASGALGTPTPLVAEAHSAGLAVHPWTFRAENTFLPADLRSGTDPAGRGDLTAEIVAYLEAGIDGFFTDHPDIGVRARDAFAARGSRPP